MLALDIPVLCFGGQVSLVSAMLRPLKSLFCLPELTERLSDFFGVWRDDRL